MGNVQMDPGELRRIAERLLGDREFDYRPDLTAAYEKLVAANGLGAALDNRTDGYLYGRSGIGAFHDSCVQDVTILFENMDFGLIAVSNVLAAVAEDYVETDGDAGADLASTLEYFAGTVGPVPR